MFLNFNNQHAPDFTGDVGVNIKGDYVGITDHMKKEPESVVTKNFLKQLSRGVVKSVPIGGNLLEQIIYGTLDGEEAENEKRKIDKFFQENRRKIKEQDITIKQILKEIHESTLMTESIDLQLSLLLKLIDDPENTPLPRLIKRIVDQVLRETSKKSSQLAPKKGDYAYVKLFGDIIGVVVWDDNNNLGRFNYHSEFYLKFIEPSPLMMPVDEGKKDYSFPRLPLTFYGLPGLLSDSLPDKFGNELINAWLSRRRINIRDFNPVKKLLYIGKRGMGALEYTPFLNGEIDKSIPIELAEMVAISNRVINDFSPGHINANDLRSETLNDILKIGSSAGGSRPKIIIGFNSNTGEMYSGQTQLPEGFDHWILKIESKNNSQKKDRSHNRMEFVYYKMALDCRIEMNECRLLETTNGDHLMSRRFDRIGATQKVHAQTLAAIAHYDYSLAGFYSYEQAFDVMQKLALSPEDIEQLYRVMVFNVVTRNCDDHTKNITFLMNEKGEWKLSPAYDLTYAYDPSSRWTSGHQMTINGKRERITRYDLVGVGIQQNIDISEQIIDEIIAVISRWKTYACDAGVIKDFSDEIGRHHLTHGELSPKSRRGSMEWVLD
ncbi:MAG: type II toxin-antitoxin system HipA family toxin [Desulfobacteraceae bacterium]|nr:type II toxin-antitoxin system HipA family toxin [Desulfobacteraceae bacterium]